MKDEIIMIEPKPYQEIGAQFVISGWVPKSWLDTGHRIDDRVFLDLIDINGETFMGTSVEVIIKNNWLSKFQKRLQFHTIFQFSEFNAYFIANSQGRINLKLSGHKKDRQLFIPVIVKNINPNFKADPEIINKHGKIGQMVVQYEKDLIELNQELERIEEDRRRKDFITKDDEPFYSYLQDWEIAGGVLNIFGQSEEISEGYPFIEEDIKEKELKDKYKDAIKWRGPLLGGVVGAMNGFQITIFSNDHGKHFHIIHRGREVNARFSFPEVELMSYKGSKNSIGSKEKDRLIEFIKSPNIFKKLENQFSKRDQLLSK